MVVGLDADIRSHVSEHTFILDVYSLKTCMQKFVLFSLGESHVCCMQVGGILTFTFTQNVKDKGFH